MNSVLPIGCSRKHPVEADAFLVEEAGDDPVEVRRLPVQLAHGDLGGIGLREAVRAGRDRREGDGADVAVLAGNLERTPVGLAEELVLAASPAAPDGADGVDDVAGGEAVAKSEDGQADGKGRVALLTEEV